MEKIKDYLKKLTDVSINRIIPIYKHHLDFNFLEFYINNFKNIDKLTILNKGNLAINPELIDATEPDTLDNIQMIIASTIILNQDKYKHLFALNELEYDPIHNYDGTETTTSTIAKRKNVDTNDYGKDVNTFEKGEERTTTNIIEKTLDTTDYKNGYNTGEWTAEVKSESHIPHSNDYVVSDEYTDINTRDSRTDTLTHEEDAYTDVVTVEKGGNLGVTTTQQMMTQEVDYWSSFNAMNILMNDCIEAITLPIYVE